MTGLVHIYQMFINPNLAALALGPLTLFAPLTLIGLIVLPLIWWLLRVTPPKPRQQTFPPLRILAQVTPEDETPNSTPLWLLLFRLLLVSLIAFALARPFITQPEGNSARPLTLIIDTGWDAAANWTSLLKEAENRAAQARRENMDIQIILTQAPEIAGEISAEPMSAADALRRLKSLRPQALPSDRAAALEKLSKADLAPRNLVWLSSQISFSDPAETKLLNRIKDAASAVRLVPLAENLPSLPGELTESAKGFRSKWHRVETASLASRDIVALDMSGQVLSRSLISFSPGQSEAETELELPSQIRRKVSLLRADGVQSAGSVKLLDDSWGRPLIGVLSGGSQSGSPLLSEPFYAEKALQPYADIYKGGANELLPLNPGILIMPDSSRSITPELRDYVNKGGLLIRFAGPRMAKRPDDLLPVTLREGGRALGGALTWEDPQKIANFNTDSPFYGLAIPADVLIKRQVMAESGAVTDSRTWARLEDGSPIVTSSEQELGRIVLFHVTAGPQWSNLPLSGLYVDMLQRLLPLARAAPSQLERGNGDWAANRVLTAYGRLSAPGPNVRSISNKDFDGAVISSAHPPGFYKQGTRRGVLNTVPDPALISTLPEVSGIAVKTYGLTKRRTLEGSLLTLALLLLALDAMFALFLAGRKPRFWPSRREPKEAADTISRAASGLIVAAIFGLALSPHSHAQGAEISEQRLTDATGLHLAFIKTGDSGTDWLSEVAMRGLKNALTERTTIEPGGVRGVNPAIDALELYPFLYWPIDRQSPALSERAAAQLNQFMASGGTIIFDTQDAGDSALLAGQPHPGLKRVTEKLDIPVLTQIPDDHVLTKSFYLLDIFAGRWANGPVWVDRNVNGAARDGVSSVIIGSNDWAAAWASDDDGQPVIATLERDIANQREMAIRFGVNIAMYTLSGNYKADQVHSAALIERLGWREQKQKAQDLLQQKDKDD